jgi:hypothetical protein
MGPPEAVLERQWWADAPMNDGSFSFDGALTQPSRVAPAWPEGFAMRPRITLEIRINVAACLFGIAAIIKVLI